MPRPQQEQPCPPRSPLSSRIPIPPPPRGDRSCAAGSLPAPLRQLRIIALAAINNLYLPLRSSRDVPWDAEASLPRDSAPRRCSAPATVTLPVPGALARLWRVAEWPGQPGGRWACGFALSLQLCRAVYRPGAVSTGMDLEEGEEILGREGLFSEFCLQREEKKKERKEKKKKKEMRKKKRQMSIFFSLLLMEARRACGDLSPRFACLEGKR